MARRRISNLRVSGPPERSKPCPHSRVSPANQSPPANARTRNVNLRTEVLISEDSPIIQTEIEVIAALLDDWDIILAESDGE